MANNQEYGQDDVPKHIAFYADFLKRHVSQISEHVDSVQLMATRLMSNGETEVYFYGAGNIYARIASAQDWLKRV